MRWAPNQWLARMIVCGVVVWAEPESMFGERAVPVDLRDEQGGTGVEVPDLVGFDAVEGGEGGGFEEEVDRGRHGARAGEARR